MAGELVDKIVTVVLDMALVGVLADDVGKIFAGGVDEVLVKVLKK